MPLTSQYLEVNFGAAYTGLAGTVGYQLRDSAGAAVGSRVTAGITEPDAGSGTYIVVVASVADNVASIVWDTGGGSPVYASEDLDPYHDRAAILADTDAIDTRLPTDPADESLQQAAHAQTQADIGALNNLAQSDILSDATPFAGSNIDATITSRESEADASSRASTNQTEHDATQAAIAALENVSVSDLLGGVVDGALTVQDVLSYLVAMAAGEFTETDVGSGVLEYSFEDRSSSTLYTLRIDTTTGARTRTFG